MVHAFIFPGQGSQAVGMGRDLAGAFPAAREVFQEIDDALGQNLSRLMFEGPAETLTLTENAQPALMAVSLAALRVLEREGGLVLADRVAAVAGHSLGEYSALAAARALDVAATAKLLRLRGAAMQRCVAPGEGAMAALLGVDLDAAEAICAAAAEGPDGRPETREVVQPANDNGGGQVVISGAKVAVDAAIEIAKGNGVRRAVPLAVSAPFHCPLMQPAAEAMAAALSEVAIAPPKVPLVANVLAAPLTDPQDIRQRLVEQVTGTVRWRECVVYMAAHGANVFIELGAGKVLTGLLKRIVAEAQGFAIGTPDEITAYQSIPA